MNRVIRRDEGHALSSAKGAAKYTYGLNGVDVKMDSTLTHTMWIIIAVLCLTILTVRIIQFMNERSRVLFAIHTPNNAKYWENDQSRWWPWFKTHVLYAPLGRKRHNRELQLSSAVSVGTLPSRFHTILLLSYVVCNGSYLFILNWGEEQAALLAELRGRSGHLALVNMLPLFILAGRNNPFIKLLRISFDTMNLFHRWVGRMVILQSLIHTVCWAANTTSAHGMHGANAAMSRSKFLMWGMVGTAAMCILLLQSPSPVRHAFYETFLHCHQLLALIVVVSVWLHCKLGSLPGEYYIYLCTAAWGLERSFRLFRLIYHNYTPSKGLTKIRVEALPGSGEQSLQAIRLTVACPRPWTYYPGTHAYIYIPSISFWMNHPFSVAWSSSRGSPLPAIPLSPYPPDPKTPVSPTDTFSSDLEKSFAKRPSIAQITGPNDQDLHFILAKRTGMTAQLYNLAARSPSNTITLSGAVEGPYGGTESLSSYGTAVLFAGGIGITHQIGHIRHLLQGHATNTTATRKIILIWSVKNTETLEWVRPFMDEILKMKGRREVLKVVLFVTQPRCRAEVRSRSERVLLYPGRVNPYLMIKEEVRTRVGSAIVTCCGPGALGDEVRSAVRRVVEESQEPEGKPTVDFVEEAFSW